MLASPAIPGDFRGEYHADGVSDFAANFAAHLTPRGNMSQHDSSSVHGKNRMKWDKMAWHETG